MTMCSTNSCNSALLPFGMKLASQSPYLSINNPHLSLELQRAQLQEYTQRLQLGLRSFPGQMSSLNPLSYHGHLTNPYLHPYFYKDPRARFIHEEPKPNHSYIGLIAMAILSSREKKLVLSDIYQWILDNYSYFRTRGPGWRNSIRHNLSLNDCFIKAGRSANGKGHYWAIHPANTEDFQKGDFRRRRAQRRVRKHMGLSVPDDDDDDDSPAPSPITSHQPQPMTWEVDNVDKVIDCTKDDDSDQVQVQCHSDVTSPDDRGVILRASPSSDRSPVSPAKRPKRMFDMESLLAPDHVTDRHGTDSESALSNDSAKTSDDVLIAKTDDNTRSDESGSPEHKRQAVDLTLTRDSIDTDKYLKRPLIGSVLNANEHLIKSTTGISGKALPYLPQLVSGIHRGAELQQRVSAFRNAGAYSWASLSGYLSNYQLMTLSSQHQSLIQRGAVESESPARWHQPSTSININTQDISAKESMGTESGRD